MTQARLAEWRERLLTDWAQTREELIAQLKACRRDDWAQKVGSCERDQLVDLTSRLDLPKVELSVARLKRLDAALCQMELGLYGLCSDCEEPLAIDQLDQDPSLQRCPRCETRYRKVLQSKAHTPDEIYALWIERNKPPINQ
ncbi:conjugal transfer protein TraR [Aeromonas rivipollensis]|uniref:TraR/DksA family transcriptional regulator n=1 Tax=Aeromonas rivipollensis TaxID=948519 RepID=UPI0030B86F8F